MSDVSRREFVRRVAVAGAALQASGAILGSAGPSFAAAPASAPTGPTVEGGGNGESVELHWLDGSTPEILAGTTWGVPWPRGTQRNGQAFALSNARGEAVAVQSWPLAYWPDGSLKWTAHAIGAEVKPADGFVLKAGEAGAPKTAVAVKDSGDAIEVDTGVIRCRVAKKGEKIIQSIEREGKTIARDGELVALRQDQPTPEDNGSVQRQKFTSAIESAAVESSGPVRVVVKVEGKHAAEGRAWLPFTLRLYFYAGAESVRIMHTFIFDGDEHKDFICGLGVRLAVPMKDQLTDRHVRFVGEGKGLWAEAIRGLTGLRRDPGKEVREAQLAGLPTPPADQLPPAVGDRLQYVPAWGDYTLSQLSADGFAIRKRTKAGYGWISAATGHRAAGVGYIGGVSGGVAFGVRDFWQKQPAQLDIRGAAGDAAEVTMWLWSPDANPMDLRFYHDDMGMTDHEKELQGLDITYEDYEKGFGTPHGIARTSEFQLFALPKTPTRDRMIEIADVVRTPALLACSPRQYLTAGVFGSLWSLPDRSTPAKAKIEDQLAYLLEYYRKEREQRHWYGFWDYGDVMHTYDADRHCWRYDVGGFAWDNSELSPDLWLWMSFLRTGDPKVFRFAEAMTRHTGEVDVYHLGRFKGLGSRHNVQHWGCSAKQVRISTVVYRRFYYYLTADERVGDLMRELVNCQETFLTMDPIRKIRKGPYHPDPHSVELSFGTDFSGVIAAWMTEWERTGDEKLKEKIVNAMKSIAAQPHGFITGYGGLDPDTGIFKNTRGNAVDVSHLSAVFGLVEICAELNQLLDVPEFKKAWLQYCELYNAPASEQEKAVGASWRSGLKESHSRLTAYAAKQEKDAKLAERAWREFYSGSMGLGLHELATNHVEGPNVLNPIDELPWVSTNAVAQWGLAAIEDLALVGDALPPEGLKSPRAGRGGRGGE